MNIETTKLELVKMILNTEEESLLLQVKQILENNGDWWDSITDEEKAAIDEGMAQLDRGEGIPHEEVMKRVREKFKLDF